MSLLRNRHSLLFGSHHGNFARNWLGTLGPKIGGKIRTWASWALKRAPKGPIGVHTGPMFDTDRYAWVRVKQISSPSGPITHPQKTKQTHNLCFARKFKTSTVPNPPRTLQTHPYHQTLPIRIHPSPFGLQIKHIRRTLICGDRSNMFPILPGSPHPRFSRFCPD